MANSTDSPVMRTFIGGFIGMLLSLLLFLVVTDINEKRHKDTYLCIPKSALVKAGFAEWDWDKKFVLKKETSAFYVFAESKEGK